LAVTARPCDWTRSARPSSGRCVSHWSTNSSSWQPTTPLADGLSASPRRSTPRSSATPPCAARRQCPRSAAIPGCSTTRWMSGRCAVHPQPAREPGSRSVRHCSDCCARTIRFPRTGSRRHRSCQAGRRCPRAGDPCSSRCWRSSLRTNSSSICAPVPMPRSVGCPEPSRSRCWPSVPMARAPWSAIQQGAQGSAGARLGNDEVGARRCCTRGRRRTPRRYASGTSGQRSHRRHPRIACTSTTTVSAPARRSSEIR